MAVHRSNHKNIFKLFFKLKYLNSTTNDQKSNEKQPNVDMLIKAVAQRQ